MRRSQTCQYLFISSSELTKSGKEPWEHDKPKELHEMIMEDSKIEMHMGQAKWAEMAAWESLDEATRKAIVMRKLDERIMHKEFKIGYKKHKVETLKMIRQALEKK